MPEEYMDPSGNTQQFKAFAAQPEPAAPASSKLPLVIGAAVAAVVVVALIVWFAVS